MPRPIKIIMRVGITLMLAQVIATFFKDLAKARGEPLSWRRPASPAATGDGACGQRRCAAARRLWFPSPPERKTAGA